MKSLKMTLWIFAQAEHVSGAYHSHGGLAVIATDEAGARALVATDPDIQLTDLEWQAAETFEVKAIAPKLWVFPNAGCC